MMKRIMTRRRSSRIRFPEQRATLPQRRLAHRFLRQVYSGRGGCFGIESGNLGRSRTVSCGVKSEQSCELGVDGCDYDRVFLIGSVSVSFGVWEDWWRSEIQDGNGNGGGGVWFGRVMAMDENFVFIVDAVDVLEKRIVFCSRWYRCGGCC